MTATPHRRAQPSGPGDEAAGGERRRALGAWIIGGAAALGYGWWATSLGSFTVTAYVAVAIPIVLVTAGAVRFPRAQVVASRGSEGVPGLRNRAFAPWWVIAVLAIGLEAAALALGGRSRTAPSLSTVADHAVRWHGTRLVAWMAWILVAVVPLLRRRLGRSGRKPA